MNSNAFHNLHNRMFTLGAACLALGAAVTPAQAQQNYPNKPVRILVGFLPGSTADAAGRVVGQILTERFKQSVLVDNRSGANGLVAIQTLTSSPGDGYTLLLATTGALTISPAVEKDLPYNSLTSFKPIALVAAFPYVIGARHDLPVNDVKGLVAYSKANPGKLNFGSAGNYSANHLGIEWLKGLTGLDAQHVPFKGGTAALTELVAGRIDFTLASPGTAMQQVSAGKIKGLAVTSATRTPLAEGLTTAVEQGIQGFVVQPWNGLMGPASLGIPIVNRLNEVINEGLKQPAYQDALFKQGMYALTDTPEGFQRLIAQELTTWAGVIKRSVVEK